MDKLDMILDRLDKIDHEITKINNEISFMKSQIDENTQITRALRDGQEEIKAQIDAMATDLHQLNGRVTALEERQQRLEKAQNRFEEKLDKIGMNVELLAVRSIEQEAEIKALKRAR